MSQRTAQLILLVILGVYLALGAAYATQTPAWQAPDEPAHYNYIRYLAEARALPVLHPGDYDQTYNETFTRSPQHIATLSIDPLRYENYAPPLYYVLAVPAYVLGSGWYGALRLFTVLLGALLVVVAYLIGAEVFPQQLPIALGGAAFVAFVPQHLAILSAINNDVLSELLIALTVLQCLRLLRATIITSRQIIFLGLTLGFGLLTKATFYYTAVPIAFVTIIVLARRHGLRFTHYALLVFPALLIVAPWWLRNMSVYGGFDALGLAQHNAIVVGQPTTAEWINTYGVGGVWQRFLTTTYRSFWGQFGWMAVPMQDRDYLLLGMLSLGAMVGLAWWALERMKDEGGRMKRPSSQALILLLWLLLTIGGYLYYNVTFVQHQGRYLFPALIPIGLGFAIGWWQMLEKIKQVLARVIRSNRWAPWLDRVQWAAFALIFIILPALDLIALQRYIIPNLSA